MKENCCFLLNYCNQSCSSLRFRAYIFILLFMGGKGGEDRDSFPFMLMNICPHFPAMIIKRNDLFLKDSIWSTSLCFYSIFPPEYKKVDGSALACMAVIRQDWVQNGRLKQWITRAFYNLETHVNTWKQWTLKKKPNFVKWLYSNSSSWIWY